jgi:hypothetical protein
MPQTLVIALMVLGAVLLLIAITGGQFKIFVAEVDTPVSSKPLRFTAGILGLAFIVGALVLNKMTPPPHEHHSRDDAGGSAASSTPSDGSAAPAATNQAATNPVTNPPSNPATNPATNPAISSYEYAIVFDPPTNIRVEPTTGADVQCSVTAKASIKILGSEGNWYRTDICGDGKVGYIYRNQVKF